MKRATVRMALLHVPEAERVPLVSAVNSIQTAGLLSAALEWTRVDDADLLITDEDQAETEPTFQALHAERPRTRLRYSGRRGTTAEIARPIRVQLLTDALQRAVDEVLARPPTAAPDAKGMSALRYRGAEVARALLPGTAPATKDGDPPAPPPGRVYRGQRY